ncbi:MAG TPA: hypothetical protein PL125_05035 [Candidatus Omnitrophota bacterium]|nr:hypothetical protein [Candidatus Omnitrophota bacterium]HPT39541.1 hypothetical protein [Candidatus Omnitrophota bacterium]
MGNAEAIVTEISVNCQNKILPPLIIYGRFLDNFPNWRHAVYQGNLFLGPKIEDKHKPLVQSLFQDIDITLLEPSFIRKGCFEIRPDKINFHKSGIIFNGIITDIEIIKQTIRLLAEISRRIESADISTKMGMITDQKEAKAGSLKIQMSTPIIIMAELTLLFGVFTIAVGIVWMFRQAMK